MSSENEQPLRRTVGRHAAPRDTVRGRLSRPVGRAIALTAMPTALLMGTLAPKLAFAADAKAKVAPNSVPDKSGPSGEACTKGAPGTGTGATTGTPTTGAKGASGTKATTGKPAAGSGVSHTVTAPSPQGGGSVPQQRTTPPATTTGSGSTTGSGGTAKTPTPTPTPTRSAPAKSAPTDPVTTILNGLGGILGLTSQPVTTAKTATAAPAPSPSATASSAATHTAAHRAAAAATPSAQPTATAAPTKAAPTPTASATPSASNPAAPTTGKPSGTGAGATGSTAAAPNTDPSKPCDISHLAAPLDTSITSQLPGGTMPIEPWTLKSNDLKLINTEFHGVVTIQLADGSTERVLKFTAEEVNIGNLDMSANQRGQEIHVKGGPSTTSTMRGGTVTMYVKELKGTLLAAEGIPLSLLNVSLDLTPDTLPQWLYNLIGAIPIPLTLELGDMTAVQAGQFGGNLTIPGMHLYYTPLGQ
ncbi:hypothetical protein [Streptacidiphilus rugosus]|uniref:hypothetical protein n=1 Tax=Streptacidiphilus rugosus TaxID=405783 RepID=UPI0006921BD1|nr:hypothetical protein [Streptacidiphilus rugosus]